MVFEVEGRGVDAALDEMDFIESYQADHPTNGRRRYRISVAGDLDIRPELFKMAKRNDWMLWELHHEAQSLGELFRTLTDESQQLPYNGDDAANADV